MKSIGLRSHLANFKYLLFLYLTVEILLRFVFLVWSGGPTLWLPVITAALVGFLNDLSTLIYLAAPWVLFGVLVIPFKNSNVGLRVYKIAAFAVTLLMSTGIILISTSEITFWNEFHARFNFIAVDYLVYTSEVLKNIWESYPVGWLVLAILFIGFTFSFFFLKKYRVEILPGYQLKARLLTLLAYVLLVFLNYSLFPSNLGEFQRSYVMDEISKNGMFSLFSAYFHNELDFNRFYLTRDESEIFKIVRARFQSEGELVAVPNSITRKITTEGIFKPYNVIIVSMESMSAHFMQSFGSQRNLTPNLDRMAKEGLFFSNIFSTGTRTVRGLEAISLSIPPTPGQSILRREKNENLYNIGDYFEDVGYLTEFLYGGYGYFDNMNEFFSRNGFTIWDQAKISADQISFKNAWGICDEDLFQMSIRRADYAVAAQKKFFQIIMTTSNHRPYTFPQKIDIPSGSGRDGAVKYADYAIGAFIEAARQKPWFKDTVFVFVADHDASVAGNVDVPVADFRIPFIIYAPGIVEPKTVKTLGSQIDVAPTVLGLLNAAYTSHFFGHDLMKTEDGRAFLGTYQRVGMLRDGILTLLGPNKTSEQFLIGPGDSELPLSQIRKDLLDETISFYQIASLLFHNRSLVDIGDDEIHNLPHLKK